MKQVNIKRYKLAKLKFLLIFGGLLALCVGLFFLPYTLDYVEVGYIFGLMGGAVFLTFFVLSLFMIKGNTYYYQDNVYYLYAGFTIKLFKNNVLVDAYNSSSRYHSITVMSQEDGYILSFEVGEFGKPIVRRDNVLLNIKSKTLY